MCLLPSSMLGWQKLSYTEYLSLVVTHVTKGRHYILNERGIVRLAWTRLYNQIHHPIIIVEMASTAPGYFSVACVADNLCTSLRSRCARGFYSYLSGWARHMSQPMSVVFDFLVSPRTNESTRTQVADGVAEVESGIVDLFSLLQCYEFLAFTGRLCSESESTMFCDWYTLVTELIKFMPKDISASELDNEDLFVKRVAAQFYMVIRRCIPYPTLIAQSRQVLISSSLSPPSSSSLSSSVRSSLQPPSPPQAPTSSLLPSSTPSILQSYLHTQQQQQRNQRQRQPQPAGHHQSYQSRPISTYIDSTTASSSTDMDQERYQSEESDDPWDEGDQWDAENPWDGTDEGEEATYGSSSFSSSTTQQQQQPPPPPQLPPPQKEEEQLQQRQQQQQVLPPPVIIRPLNMKP